MSRVPEHVARSLFLKAVSEKRAAELLENLFDGGSATIDAVTGELIMISNDVVRQLGGKAVDEDQS